MKKIAVACLTIATILAAATVATAQRAKSSANSAQGAEQFAERMLQFDANKDGKVTREELTDERLSLLFDRADEDKDGVLTKQELTALGSKEEPRGGSGGPGGRGPGGPGGGFGGPGGRGMGGPPRIGEILPGFFQDRLGLDEAQKKKVAELQAEVDEKLNKILTAEQAAQLKEMRQRGPGGPGGRGGPGGPPPGRGEPN